jgi:uncharacterized protein (UPF0248 family)
MARRKGAIREIISKALYYDDPSDYRIFYRDFESVVEVSLAEFIEASNFLETIPITRIVEIRKTNQVIYKKINYRKLCVID